MKSFGLKKVCALLAATLILPVLAYAQNNQGGNNQGNYPHAPEANAGWVLVPFFGVVLLFFGATALPWEGDRIERLLNRCDYKLSFVGRRAGSSDCRPEISAIKFGQQTCHYKPLQMLGTVEWQQRRFYSAFS